MEPTLFERTAALFPDVTSIQWFMFHRNNQIVFRNDSDGNGDYYYVWDELASGLVCPFPELIRGPMSLMSGENE